MTAHARLAAFACVLLAGACHFERAHYAAPAERNACSVDADCGERSSCEGGMCVALEAEEPLTVVLEVTPARVAEGREPNPLLLAPLTVDGPLERPFELTSAVEVFGSVRDGGRALDAEVRFTPTAVLPGLLDPSVTVSTAPFSIRGEYDYAVILARGAQYRQTVRPVDPKFPPFSRVLVAGDDDELDLSYEPAPERRTQTVRVLGGPAPEERVLLVRAFDELTGEAVSSSESVVDGAATLWLSRDAGAYRLEIRAEQSYEPVHTVAQGIAGCDEDTPVYPTFRVLERELPRDQDDALVVELPEPPARVRYEGTIALCPRAEGELSLADLRLAELPMTLRGNALALPGDTPVTAEFHAATTARYDEEGEALRFCVHVMEGEYDVVVTPPTDTGCGLFAEQRVVKAPDDKVASGSLLELGASAYLQGTLKTRDLQALADATVDAVALARADAVALADGDRGVTRYNRSQQTTTDERGAFRLGVDLGSYDVVIKPPADSGYPWQIRHDVGIGARGVEFPTVIDMLAPITLSGTLAYAGDDGELADAFADADVSAYALIDEGQATERVVPIGKTTADATGRFMLLLPPSIQAGW